MLRNALVAGAALMLGGCLTTPEPVFDASNSQLVGEMPKFLAILNIWESFAGSGDSPRELIEKGQRGVIVDGLVVVQERNEYYALGVIGGRPVGCVIHADEDFEQTATAQGITVEVDRSETKSLGDLAPAPVKADGTPEALRAFIRDQFANQALACSMPKRGGG